MKTSERYHRSVLEAVSAFVRDRTKNDNNGGPPATDVQAALTVIGRRAETEPPEMVDLEGVRIPGYIDARSRTPAEIAKVLFEKMFIGVAA
jgi:hypothetical protein